jgi:hypothetical protein
MVTPTGSIALVPVLWLRGGLAMSKEEAILSYKASMAAFRHYLADGAITETDPLAIDTMLAEKYGLSSCSIYLENDLLCGEKRAIDSTVKGGHYGQKNN